MLPKLIGYNLRRAQVAVFQDFAATVGKLDITPGQAGVLMIVEANPGLKQTELAGALRIDRSTVVAVIDRLEGRGLLRRAPAPGDRRSYALRLSAKGGRLLGRLGALIAQHERKIARNLSAAEKATLVRLLGRLAEKG